MNQPSHNHSHLTRLENRLSEAFDAMYNQLVDPRDAYLDANGCEWLPLGGDDAATASAGWAFRTEAEHRAIRHRCRALAVNNEFAINGHENRISYLVGAGHTYRATGKKHCQTPESLPAEVQQVLDAFLRDNQWHRRQQEIVRRRDRDGEAFLRFFTSADGSVRVRFVEPDLVTTPPELATRPASSFGIETEPHDVETVLGYYIAGQPVPAAEIQHRKAHVDGAVKRGLPLFHPVYNNLRRAEKLLRNMSVLAEIQSAIALIRKHRRGTRASVQQFVDDQADATATNAASYVTVLQAELRAIASRLVMPEFMLSSDASNANYASTLVAEGPAVRFFERLQAEQMADDLEVMWRVVDTAITAGRLPIEARELIEIQASPPSLAVRDALREAQVHRIEHERGILSPQTWSGRRGLDYDQEQANLEKHKTQQREAEARGRE